MATFFGLTPGFTVTNFVFSLAGNVFFEVFFRAGDFVAAFLTTCLTAFALPVVLTAGFATGDFLTAFPAAFFLGVDFFAFVAIRISLRFPDAPVNRFFDSVSPCADDTDAYRTETCHSLPHIFDFVRKKPYMYRVKRGSSARLGRDGGMHKRRYDLFNWPGATATSRGIACIVWVLAALPSDGAQASAADIEGAAAFRKDVEPILSDFCYGCHSGGAAKAQIAFDEFKTDREIVESRDLWWKALKQLRAGLMPPRDQSQPSAEQRQQIAVWIKKYAFQIDSQNPDPGRVTVRRLNRIEYRNTVRDLTGIEYRTESEFPPDDTGHGFDNIGDVLTMSPLLLEKYIVAAKSVILQAVPVVSGTPPEKTIDGNNFHILVAPDPASTESEKDDSTNTEAANTEPANQAGKNRGKRNRGPGDLSLSYYQPATAETGFKTDHAGKYQLAVHVSANEKYVEGVFDYNKCNLAFKVDGAVLFEQEFVRQEGKSYHFEFDQDWQAGQHNLQFELKPLTPDEKQTRSLALRIVSVKVRGPLAREHWVRPKTYERFFPRAVPDGAAERREYARELLQRFATRAFRRPAELETVDRLVNLAESLYGGGAHTFEAGVAAAMTAVLASPRFLFREERIAAGPASSHPFIDEFALASRLSYFLWSSMPDEELWRLAEQNKLRENQPAQLKRMLADLRSKEFIRHFIGQWLQARDIDAVNINAFAVVSRDQQPDPDSEKRRTRFRELRSKSFESLTPEEKTELDEARKAFASGARRFAQFELNGDLRRAMRRETEMLFEHIVQQDRSLLELIDSDYTFLNERLAKHYGIDDVKGDEMRLVQLAAGSPRGGVLTQGTVLAVTSNPDRTSPVKRGLFILDNLLGTPPAPPPPNIPALEDAAKKFSGRTPTLRETLELHRSEALCNSCHARMDPLGLALENFNALGMFRESRPDREIEPAGQLITGETFTNVRELKHILVHERRRDFYRCLTEKLLTYALGRGLEYQDVEVVDTIVERIEKENGRFSALLMGIVESAPFQKTRAHRLNGA